MVAQTRISSSTADRPILKKLFILAILLTGCASQPQSFNELDMVNFKADCAQARFQVDYLQKRIDAYNEWFQSHPITLQDRRYYSALKNNIWSLRSSCSALQH